MASRGLAPAHCPCAPALMHSPCAQALMHSPCAQALMHSPCAQALMHSPCAQALMHSPCAQALMHSPCALALMHSPCAQALMHSPCAQALMHSPCAQAILKNEGPLQSSTQQLSTSLGGIPPPPTSHSHTHTDEGGKVSKPRLYLQTRGRRKYAATASRGTDIRLSPRKCTTRPPCGHFGAMTTLGWQLLVLASLAPLASGG